MLHAACRVEETGTAAVMSATADLYLYGKTSPGVDLARLAGRRSEPKIGRSLTANQKSLRELYDKLKLFVWIRNGVG